jgi:hypothetical protein
MATGLGLWDRVIFLLGLPASFRRGEDLWDFASRCEQAEMAARERLTPAHFFGRPFSNWR